MVKEVNRLLDRMVAQHNSPPMAGGQRKLYNFPIQASGTIRNQHVLESRIQELL